MVYHHKRNETINGVYFKSTGLTMFFLPAPYRTIGIEMKQCGNCWGLLSTLGLTGRVGGASEGWKRTGTLISQAVVLGENIIRKWKCNWKSESGIGESIIRKWKLSFFFKWTWPNNNVTRKWYCMWKKWIKTKS